MSPSKKTRLYFVGAFLVMASAVCIFLPLCGISTMPAVLIPQVPTVDGGGIRGYSTGKECYYGGGCYSLSEFSACATCCLNACPTLASGCIDECISHSEPPRVFETMLKAQKVLRQRTPDPSAFEESRALLVSMTSSSNKTVAGASRLLLKEADAETGHDFLFP